ncbi:MAG TPA: potassium-transporting ATPase subunit KdpA [Actinomycetota bacterium]|nr:potassium-transporting ATPase subunit KdpA [Actinomycetota bacterium]
MTQTAAALLQLAALVGALLLVQWPLGTYIAKILTDQRDNRLERGIYRLVGADPASRQPWSRYAVSVLAFCAMGLLLLYGLLRMQAMLPWNLGMAAVPASGAFNTAASFVTNTNWQWYSGESTLGYLAQMAGLTVQNFVSAAVGISVAFALLRGFLASGANEVGNFWVDITRTVMRLLLPIAALAAALLMLGGAIQNLSDPVTVNTLSGGSQTLPGGPVATQEVIKQLGTNGGGFYNANSAHPFENPTPFTNLFQIFLMLVIPFSLPRAMGIVLGNKRQGVAILSAMGILWLVSAATITWAEMAGKGLAPELAGAAMEGKEVRFGVTGSALFASATTGTSTGAVDAMHDSFTAAGGGLAMLNMMLGEVSPGGTGSGLYGMLVAAILAVFLAGLMVGRTPEIYGKRIGRREVTMVALYILTTPVILLVGAALTAVVPALVTASVSQAGPHGLSGLLYAYTSASNNNGSAFASFGAATTYQNTALGLAMLFGRFVPIVLVLALAGSLAEQTRKPPGPGTLPTDKPLFVGLLVVVVLFVAALTYVPALALGPVAEALL